MYSIKQFANMLVKRLKRLTYILVSSFISQNVKRMKLEILNKIFSLILKFYRNTYIKSTEYRLRTTEIYNTHTFVDNINAVYKCNIISRSISLIFGRCYGNEIILYVYNYVLYIILCIVHLYVYGITMYNITYVCRFYFPRTPKHYIVSKAFDWRNR